MKIFATYDLKAQHFIKVFVDESTVNALRGFEIAVLEPGTILSKYPDDFALFELGEVNKLKGELLPYPNPVNLGSGRQFVKVTQ